MDINEKRRQAQRAMPTFGGYTKGPGGIPGAYVQVTPNQVRTTTTIRTPHGTAVVNQRPRRSGHR